MITFFNQKGPGNPLNESKFVRVVMARFVLLLMVLVGSVNTAFSEGGNRFVWTFLEYQGDWNPYPSVPRMVLDLVKSMTNIALSSEIRSVKLSDNGVFETPVLFVKGNSALVFSELEKKNLKLFIERGGFVFFDDTMANSQSPFAVSIRRVVEELFPSKSLKPIDSNHAVYRSFFLLRKAAGRKMDGRYLEALDLEGSLGGEARTAVIYCPFDVLGAWVKDPLGQYVYSCEPGGETQRWEAFKLTLNVIYFSLTGTYKKDAVHQPFIEQKLGVE